MKPPFPQPHGDAEKPGPRRSLFRFLCAACVVGGALSLLAGVGLFAGNIYLHSRYSTLTVLDGGQLLFERETPIA